jgi:hypothetical protein
MSSPRPLYLNAGPCFSSVAISRALLEPRIPLNILARVVRI